MNPFPLADDLDKKLSPCDVPNEPWHATDWDSADPLPLFCPDAYIPPDVPPAPPPEDFPLGCLVHVRGEERLQLVQGERYWGDLQQLLAVAKRYVKVVRHSGDYTFVLAEDNSDFIVGCSVHRACLGPPRSGIQPKEFYFSNVSRTGLSLSDRRLSGGSDAMSSFLRNVGCRRMSQSDSQVARPTRQENLLPSPVKFFYVKK